MKDLTLEELIQQIYCCLSLQYFRKMKQENLTFEIVDINDNIIDSDEAVKQSFMMKEASVKILWRSLKQSIIEKHKIIKNALVVMIGISEYMDNKKCGLSNVKNDVKNFKELFEQELNYEFVYSQSPQMTKEDVQIFMDRLF
ncbi:hypothetical protein RFI_36289, partial [Reticulomyxa filosa]